MTVTATHQTAETRFVDAGGVRFAFRRFGAPGATLLVMLQHVRAQIRIYPDSAHAFLFQEPEQVAARVNAFLASPTTAS